MYNDSLIAPRHDLQTPDMSPTTLLQLLPRAMDMPAIRPRTPGELPSLEPALIP